MVLEPGATTGLFNIVVDCFIEHFTWHRSLRRQCATSYPSAPALCQQCRINSQTRVYMLRWPHQKSLRKLPVTKQRLSRWIADGMALAYASISLQCPIGVRAHSTRGMASSWAWFSGVSIGDICAAAGWSLPSTTTRFYNLEVPVLQAQILSV